jgi:hypothetical protein
MKMAIYFIVLIIGFILWFMWANSEFMKIDYCLDDGGRWNYKEKKCEYKEAK